MIHAASLHEKQVAIAIQDVLLSGLRFFYGVYASPPKTSEKLCMFALKSTESVSLVVRPSMLLIPCLRVERHLLLE